MSASLRFFLIFVCMAPSAWAQNSAPIGVQDLYIVEVNQTLTISEDAGLLSNDYDPDGDSFSIVNGTLPEHGELVFGGSGGAFTYTPDEDFEGTDTFGYRIRDTAGNTANLTTVTIEVLPTANRAPVAVTDGYTTPFETPLVVSSANGLLQNDYDPDGDQVLVGVFDVSDLNGTLSNTNISTGSFTYTPSPGFTGTDSFRYLVRDPDFAASTFVEVFIDVQAPTNRSPSAFSDFYGTPKDKPLVVPAAAGLLKNDYDPDGDAVLVGVFDVSGLNGSLSNTNISTGSFTYTPNSGFTGTDSFRYLVRDPDFASSTFVEVFIGVGVETVLPVELVRFEAVRDGDTVRLSWDTASETNNAGFNVERAINDTPFEPLDFVEGHGTADAPQSYVFTDTSIPVEGHNLRYRLKQIDYDGTFDYSPEIEVAIDLTVPYRLTAPYPNPSSGEVYFSLAVGRAQQVEVALYDILGRQVQMLFAGEIAAHTAKAFVVDTTNLPSGQYILRAEGAAFVETDSFVLAH